MTHNIACYRCGGSLAALSLPLSRRDECPHCEVHLHVCRQCRYFDPAAPRQCLEDDADDVSDKALLNFCDYFAPSEAAFDGREQQQSEAARDALDALFGNAEPAADTPQPEGLSDAEKLFK